MQPLVTVRPGQAASPAPVQGDGGSARVVAIVGHHNVGKSALFNRLTGLYVSVANYPGTTVEVARGLARALPGAEVIDTPGVVSFPAQTEDEQATLQTLLREPLAAVVQVGDAKNLRRTLLLTVQLAEMGIPLVLALNMTDEAEARGVAVDAERLRDLLGIPVVPTVAIEGKGTDVLPSAISQASPPDCRVVYPPEIEAAVQEIAPRLPRTRIASRALGLLWLCGDSVVEAYAAECLDPEILQVLRDRRDLLQLAFNEPISVVVQRARLAHAERLAAATAVDKGRHPTGIAERLARLTTHPVWGLPVLAVVLYAMYWFVGIFGAGTLVGLLEESFFGRTVNPWMADWVGRLAPHPTVAEFIVGEYGLWTMGMTYALALILPIVTTFFLAFSVLEDTGYLPRLSVLSNRVFRILGLNGRAVVPMVLGLGCVTMATLSTRILASRRERLLVILLLALAVPCSAQLGVVMGMLASISSTATLIWLGVMAAVLLTVGWLAARLLPGERTPLLVELPPLRRPTMGPVVLKTAARLEWYLKEVVPLFLAGTAALFMLDRLGLLPRVIEAGQPVVSGWLGLPPEASAALLMGFLRRDFGATGLFSMESQGLLSPGQVVVAMVTITLFVPCIASVLIIARERGWRTAAAVTAVVFPMAFLVGGLLHRLLVLVGWGS